VEREGLLLIVSFNLNGMGKLGWDASMGMRIMRMDGWMDIPTTSFFCYGEIS